MTSRKQLAINQRALYDDAVKNKMFWNATPSFQEFQRRLQNPKYVQTVQANYRAHGRSGDAFDTLSGFRDYFCVSDEDKQDMTQGVGNMIADTKARLAGQQRYNKLKQFQDKQRGGFGRLNLGVKNPLTNANVVRDDATGTYLTSQGVEYAQEQDAARAQNQLDEINDNYTEAVKRGDLPSAFEVQDEDGNYALVEDLGVKPGVHVTEKGKQQQLAGLVNTRKSVEEQYNALYRKLEEDFKRSAPFSINTHSQYGIDDNDMRLQAYLNSNAQYRRLKAQLHQLDNAIRVGEEAVKGRAEERYVKNAKGMLGYAYRDLKSFGASALRGLWNAVSDVSTWDLGLQDLQDNMTLYTTVKKARQKGYENLNSEERQMLDVAAKTGAYTAENQQYLGRGYKAGNVTGESLPFMVEMALNPASGLGEAVMSKYMRNAIAKYGKEAVRKEAWKYVTKKCGYRIAGDVLGAALMTGTTGSARTLADTYDRLTGDIKSTYDSNGKIVYDGTENEEKGILKAYLKAFGATAIENHSEFVGEYFNPLLKGVGTLTMKGWKKVNAKSANAFLDNLKDMGSTSTAKWLGNLFDKTQWHGTIGEYAEEVVGNIENALLVGDSTLDTKEGTGVFNLDQNIDTFLGVSLMGGFFSTLKTGAYVRDKVKGERKILMQQSLDLDNSIRYALGADPRLADKWKEWRVALAQGTDEEKKQALKEISENTNGNIKKAMYDYSANAQKLAGMDKATQGAIEDGTITPEQAQRDADIEQAHEEGLAAEGTARHDIQQEHQLRENSLARMLGISAEQLDRMEDEDIESMTGQNDALDTAIYDYQTSRERYQGVIDRATDEVEQAGIDAAHQIDLYTDHSTGQIRPCVIKGNNGKEDYQGYIVNGNIATHPDGAIDVSGSDKMILYFDPETGKIEHGDASTFASLGESADATVARQQAIDEAKQQAAQAQSRDIDRGVGEDGNVSEAMPTFPQSSDQEERNAADFDIGQVVNAETGEVIPVSFEELAEGENAYLTGGRPDGKTKDRLKVTIVDAEGNVTNRMMKRGNVQVDGRMSAEDFRNAYEEAVSSRMAPEADINEPENNVDEEGVVAGGAAPSADKAATSEEEGAASEPAVRDKNGNPIYDKMPISATIADLYDGALDDAEIDGFVSAQIAEAEKAVEKMEKKKPKVGTDKAKYLADKKAWEEGLQEAQRKVQYWQDVKAEVDKITTPEDARGYEEELNGDAAQTAYRNGSDAASYGAREVTAEFMQSGDVKITPESYRKETGFGAAEQRAMVGKISKGGKSIDRLAEDLEVFDRENYNGMYFGGDSSVAKDAILDYLSSPDSRKGVKKMQSEAEREYVEAYEAERDRYYQEKYHMSYEEYLVYSSQEMPELLRKYSNFDEQQFYNLYAEEIEADLERREKQLKHINNGKEGNVSAGEEPRHGRGNQVQSGQRVDDRQRGNVGKDSEGEVGPRNEGVVESEAASEESGNKVEFYDPRSMSDEERLRRGEMLRDATAVEVAEGQIVATAGMSARKAAEKWWQENVPEPVFYDTEVGEVEINSKSIEDSLAHRYGQAKLDAITSLVEGFENAVYLGSMQDFVRQEGVVNHYFAYPITYKGERSYVFCRAMQDANKNRLYVHEVFVADKIKKGNTLQTAASQPHGGIALYRDILANVLDRSTSSESKDTNNTDTKQENGEKSVGGEKEPMSPTPAMIDRMIAEQRVDDVSELLISSELKKAAEGIAEAFGMKVVYLKKVFIKSDDPAVEDFEGNGFVRNGVIYLSLKEADIAQFTFGHELLHQLKQIDADSYMRIRQKVIDVMGRKAFEMEVKARQMTYANVPGYTLFEDYAEEVIADTLGDIITHTDMLPNIARSLKDNPSLLDRFLKVVDNVRQYFRGKTGGALGDLVNDIRDTYEMTARQGAELGLSTPLKITEHTKFSLKDNQGNPLNQDGTLKLDKIKSVDELTDEDFLHPTRNVELPSLPKKIADAIGTEGKPVVIKKNIFERNYMRHKDVTPDLSKIIFKSALYNPDLYGQNQKKTRPYNWVLINTKDEKGNNRTVLLEVNPNKDNVEIVHWHFIDERGLKKIRKQVDREDGQLLILPSDKEEVGALSDPTVNLSAANIDNSSETAKESEGKDRQHYASLGVSRALGEEAAEGGPRYASLALSEQQLDGDDTIRFSLRQEPAPKVTKKGYAVFIYKKLKNGGYKLVPKMLSNDPGAPAQTWLNADTGYMKRDENGEPLQNTNGRASVSVNGSQAGGNKSNKLAWRPGKHLAMYPNASQFKSPDGTIPKDVIFFEVEYAADPDLHKQYQRNAWELGMNDNGQYRNNQGGLPYIPKDSYYLYRTNSISEGATPMIITGAYKINRALTDAEAKELNQNAGGMWCPRKGGDLTEEKLKDMGLDDKGLKKMTESFDMDIIKESHDESDEARLLPGYRSREINWEDKDLIHSIEENGQNINDYRDGYVAPEHSEEPTIRFSLDKDKGTVASPSKPSKAEAVLRDAVIDRLRENGMEVITDVAEGQKVLDEANGMVRLMGSRTNKKMKEIADVLSEHELSEQQKTVVDVYSGKTDNLQLELSRNDGSRRIVIRQGNDNKAGTKHSVYRHYGTTEGVITAEDILLIPEVLNKGERKSIKRGNTQLYEYVLRNVDGAEYTVLTEINNRGKETFADFYSNKKVSSTARKTRSSEAQARLDETLSAAKVEEKSKTANKSGEKLREQRVYHGSGADFEAFDHGHMGEGQGSQVFGWGTYVTSSKAIGESYAESSSRTGGMEYTGDALTADEASLVGSLFISGMSSYHEVEEFLEKSANSDKPGAKRSANALALLRKTKPEDWRLPEIGKRQLYTVEIPEDNGSNYLDWENPLNDAQKEILKEGLMAAGVSVEYFKGLGFTLDSSFKYVYSASLPMMLRGVHVGEADNVKEKASRFLSGLGFTGIKYPAGTIHGGAEKGDMNYVIFNEKDAKITDHVRFFRTANGEAYGFTVGGKIYVDPRIATSETPVHEYAHLWATALRSGNKEEWQNVVGLMKDTKVWDEVKERYPELKTDDEIADEVIATYSGQRGAERLREEQRKIAEGDGGVFEKVEAISVLESVKRALKMFWKGVADFLHIHYKSAEEVADRVMKDLLEGVDPRKMGETKDGGVRFNAKQKRALETASLGNAPRSLTVVSSATGAKILNSIDKLVESLEKSATQPKTFIGNVAKALGASRFGSGSEYATFETKNGDIVTIRLANHNAHVSGFDHNGKDNGISIVISPKPNEGITNDGNAHITEFYYDSIKLRRADGKPLAEIVRSIKQALYSGEFKDTTGLAERQEVNGEDVIRYQFIGEKGAAEADHAEEVSVRLDNLSVAREMEAEKKDAKAIKMATGWERGADGKWRYEIADLKEFDRNGNLLYRKHHPDYARYIELQDKDLKNLLEDGEKLTDKEREEYEALSKKYESDKFGGEKLDNIHTLEAYVDAPELFKAYPELRNVRVTFKDTGGWETASYYAISDVIDFNVDDVGEIVVNTGKVTANMRTKELKSVFLHEIQHAIQVIEGFAEGGSPQYMKGLYSDYFLQDYSSSQLHELAELRRIAENKVKRGEYKRMSYAVKNVIKAAKEHGFYPTWAESFDNNPNSVTTVYDTLVKFPSEILDKAVLIDEKDLYRRVAGEVEARNVQERMGMSAEERRASLAAETEDVAREDQIFLMGNGVSEMGSRVGKRMAEIGEHYEDKALTDEERPIVDVFCGRNDNLKVSIERDGKSLVLMMRQGSENGAGTKHCLYRHYGTGVGYLTADDILKIPYIMANGFAKEKLRGKSRLVEYTYKDEQGCEYTLLTEKKKGFEIFNDFYTNRKASSLSTFNTSEDAHTGSDNALIGAKLGNVSETAKESEGKDRQHYASLGVSRSLDKEAGEGEPRWASLGLSEQQLDGDDTIRFSLNYDKWNREMASWLKRNRLPKNAQRPVVPQREAGESDLHFAGRLAKYNQDKALWNTAPKYEGHLSSGMTARGEFNYELQRGAVLKRIAIQDSMLAIRKAQEAIARHSGLLKVGTFEDAYMAENNSHGKAKNEFEQYDQEYLEPLRKWFNVMMKRLDGSYNNVTNYMIAKHGLERNAHMAFMAALEAEAKKAIGNTQPDAKRLRAQMVHDAYRQYKADSRRLINDADYEAGKYDYAQWRRTDDAIRKSYCSNYESFRYDKGGVVRDYSGLSSLFRNETDFEEKAAELCADIESKNGHETSELWDAVRQATRQILKNSHDAGMMSDETYDYVRGMYEHYIPLRGWNDSAADEVWDYAGGGRGVFNAALKEAHGRQSLADDPVAYIMNMAESGFLVNNRNWVKQHFLTMAMNHPSDLLTVSKAWYVKTKDQFGNEVWIPASPNIPADETDPAVIEAALDAFRTKMEQMELSGDATQQRGSLNIEYPQTKSEEREHEVRVMKDGEEYVVYVNGDPQLAQALNNTRAMRVREHEGNFEKACAWLGRKMAAVYTSLSPLFVPSNWARDTTMTLASTAIREDARYNWLLRTKFMRPDVQMRMFGLVKEYQNGKLREKVKSRTATKTEENFWNFMINGGETGFVSTMDVDAFREKIQRDLKDMGRTRLNPVKVGHTIADSVEYINRVIEDSNRFAIYQTSIEYGRGIEEAVQDAKNVTLNFNRKGTGEMGMSAIRQLYLFINPAIQSLQTLGALAKDHKAKFTAVTSAWMASGMLVPLFNELMFNLASAAAGGGGDDDDEFNPKEEYWKFSSFDRRNNCILWIPFTHNFIKIPLAPEFRGFYGIGDMVASAMWGGENAKESWSNYAADLMGQIIDLSPLDPVSYDGNVLVSLMPNAIRPLVEIAQNVTFTGKPIYRESDFNKYDPSFKKAYAGTPDFLLRYSKWMNSIGNKYPEAQQGPVEQTAVGRYANNPAVIDHLLKSYLGGMYTLGSQIAGAITKASDEETRKDFKTADIPFFSKFVANPNDRPQSKNKGDAYWQDFEKYQRTSHTLGVIRQDARKTGNFSVLEDFYKSEEYKEMKEYEPKAKQRKEEQKYERWKEEGNADLYQPHQQTGEDVYKRHSTPADDFEDTKASILYQKIKPAKDIFDLADINTPSGMDTFNKYYDLAGKVEEAHSVKKEMNAIVKSFVDGEHKATFDPEKMKEYRALRKQYLQLVEEGNRMFEKIKAQRN